MEERRVRIPRTSGRRNDVCWARLLWRVDRALGRGELIPFHGRLVRCGRLVREAELWPAPEYPAAPILLESAGIALAGWGHRRSQKLYILWRYERDTGAWREIARVVSATADWVWEMAPIARQAIEEQRAPRPAMEPAAVRVSACQALEDLVGELADGEKRVALAAIYDWVLWRMAEEGNAGAATGRWEAAS